MSIYLFQVSFVFQGKAKPTIVLRDSVHTSMIELYIKPLLSELMTDCKCNQYDGG